MKVIDLLNKIANGEIPKKIKYFETIYEYGNYKGDSGYVDTTQYPYKWFEKEIDCDVISDLNDEVEIIEEDKKIENLDIYNCFKVMGMDETGRLDENFTDISNKINEIIDKINKE